jgi:hypothetical protein
MAEITAGAAALGDGDHPLALPSSGAVCTCASATLVPPSTRPARRPGPGRRPVLPDAGRRTRWAAVTSMGFGIAYRAAAALKPARPPANPVAHVALAGPLDAARRYHDPVHADVVVDRTGR